ncbi:hypothetical protein GQ607_003531, partial [Colletotrichum asianum]
RRWRALAWCVKAPTAERSLDDKSTTLGFRHLSCIATLDARADADADADADAAQQARSNKQAAYLDSNLRHLTGLAISLPAVPSHRDPHQPTDLNFSIPPRSKRENPAVSYRLLALAPASQIHTGTQGPYLRGGCLLRSDATPPVQSTYIAYGFHTDMAGRPAQDSNITPGTTHPGSPFAYCTAPHRSNHPVKILCHHSARPLLWPHAVVTCFLHARPSPSASAPTCHHSGFQLPERSPPTSDGERTLALVIRHITQDLIYGRRQ